MSGDVGHVTRLVPGIAEQASPIQPKIALDANPEVSFGDMLGNFMNNVNSAQLESSSAQDMLMNGDSVELHQVMIKAEEAGISMDLLLEIRNKLVNAYNEIIRMPV
ncbi:MAG: flagellar hook-basal body complex protein FliE [Candidatus Zixiibacteriota bacterium]